MTSDHAHSFTHSFRTVQRAVNETAHDRGWYEPAKTPVECIALIHSELSEAIEALRTPGWRNQISKKIGSPFIDVEEEFADAIIRIMDLAEDMSLDVAGAIVAKAAYNKGRPIRHGELF